MKKTVLLFLFFCLGISIYAQKETSLQKQFGIEANLVAPGFGLSYELPISQKILSDFAGGFGMPIAKGWGSIAIDNNRIKPYTRIGVKYYYNRANRVNKGKEINNNRGNFIGLQNKVMYGVATDDSTVVLNEIHWGVQTELAKKLLLTFQIGGAHYYTKEKNNYFSPLLDLKIKYIIF
ncbi:hypothetical protein CAPN004_23500 [Capnocytophaga cynodegmi]|uniref:hypothetical protein n=1 Tax=Capnocytophaga cynodegmi TaxID=28189 RepID=UPI001ACC4C20|nr:hypothetical protein [Capnocytophaga cynodegmi]GIM53321.1 hypothetical protein CAPN004_23500 [Capnocytophaga cynodegmi]